MRTDPASGRQLTEFLSVVGTAQSETDPQACCERILPFLLDLVGSDAGFISVSDPRLPVSPFVAIGFEQADRSAAEGARGDWLERLAEAPEPKTMSITWHDGVLVVVPILSNGRLAGMVGWTTPKQGDADDETAWNGLSTWLGALFDGLAARASLERKLLHYDTFLETSSLLARSVGLAESLEIALFSSMNAVSAEAASLLLLNEDKTAFRFVHTHGAAKPSLGETTFSAQDGIAGRVLRTQEAEIVDDVNADGQFYGRIDSETGFVTRNLIAIPLIAGDEPIGVLEVLNRADAGAFEAEDRLLLLAVADQIAYAVRNAATFDRMVDAYCRRRQGADSCENCPQPLDVWAACRTYRERLS